MHLHAPAQSGPARAVCGERRHPTHLPISSLHVPCVRQPLGQSCLAVATDATTSEHKIAEAAAPRRGLPGCGRRIWADKRLLQRAATPQVQEHRCAGHRRGQTALG
eukprot:362860-Chlamydomonas_euryale.AAC.5